MEEIMTNAWLQDSRTKIGEVYCPGGQESESNLPSHSITLSSSSSETAEQYSLFDPYMQGDTVTPCTRDVATSSDPTSVTSDCRSEGSAMSQALEELLIYKDTATWGIHQPGDISAALKSPAGEPLHQLPGWSQHDYMMEEWQQNSSCTSFKPQTEVADPLQHGPWMMDMPPGLAYSNLNPLESQIHVPFQFHSVGPVNQGFEEYHHEQRSSQILQKNSTEVAAANRKAAARKNRILLRQKSTPHQRGGSDSLGSPRALKKMNSTKLPREFLMCNYVQVIY